MHILPTGQHQYSANQIQISAMTMTHSSGVRDAGGDLSSSDVLTTLDLGGVAQVDPEKSWEQRDRFVMSKWRCSGAFYSILPFRGFFPRELLKAFMAPLWKLNSRPDDNKLPGVEANIGPLGHGLPIGVGAALAAKIRGEAWRVLVLTFGTRAVVELPRLQRLMRVICRNGFEHHAAMNGSHCAKSVSEALSSYMGWDVYDHSAEEV